MCYKIKVQNKNAEKLDRKLDELNAPQFLRDYLNELESKNGALNYLVAIKDFLQWLIESNMNVSRVNLYNPDFLESLVNLVEKYKIPPKYLNLELTESAFSDDARMIQNAVDYLHKAGFTILMDDFGSGYSSLNVLKDIDIDVLKIDMRFLSKGSSEERGEKILEAVIKMAKSLDMLVIAEGVEEEKQVKMLKRLGCDYIQGYYFAKPMPKKDYVKLLQKSR